MEEKRIIVLQHPDKTEEVICSLLGKSKEELPFKLIVDDQHPDYIFTNEIIYYDRVVNKKFKRMCKTAKIRIFDAGECLDPDLNIFDYALVRNKNLSCGDRICVHHYADRMNYKNEITTLDEARKLLSEKNDFCNFIYSNPQGHIRRKELFDVISKYKQVDSLGKWMRNRNPDTIKYSTQNELLSDSISMKSCYKFSIACENATYNGYTSEKLMTSFRAHTIPIYWGNPTVADEFNEKAFINCHKFSSLDEIVNKIKEIDENDDLWCEMIAQPWITEEQMNRYITHKKEYHEFFMNVFCQPINEAVRRGIGFHPDKYAVWFFDRFPFDIKEPARRIKKLRHKNW